MSERNLKVKLLEVSVGHTVWYGQWRRPLIGKVSYSPSGSEEIAVIVNNEGRLSKVVLHSDTEVIDLGRPEEPVQKFRVVVPGIRP